MEKPSGEEVVITGSVAHLHSYPWVPMCPMAWSLVGLVWQESMVTAAQAAASPPGTEPKPSGITHFPNSQGCTQRTFPVARGSLLSPTASVCSWPGLPICSYASIILEFK